MRFRTLTLLFFCFLSLDTFAQSNSDLLTAADKAFAEKNYLSAINLYRKVNVPINGTRTFNVGESYAYWGNDLEALEWFKLAVDRGSVPAMRRIADILLKGGTGFEPDLKEAFEWYKLAAGKQDTEAYYKMGYCYRRGYGTAVDYTEAARWFEAAAQKGNTDAMTELAVLQFEGKGVTKDVQAGFAWLEKAAGAGDRSAMVMLARYCYEGIMLKAPDYAKAMYWFKRLVDEHSHVSSMLYIGEMYQDGKGIAKDNNQAFEWYKKGADKGSRDGMNAVGACYLKGTGVAQDYAKALEWFKKSAGRDFPKGMYNLAYMYENGFGTEKDLSEALIWYKKADEKGYNAKQAIERLQNKNW